MLRPLLLVLSGLAVLLLGGFWWLFLADSTAPAEAPGLLVLEDWREMVSSDPSLQRDTHLSSKVLCLENNEQLFLCTFPGPRTYSSSFSVNVAAASP